MPSAASARRDRRSGRSRPRCWYRSTSGRPWCSSRRSGTAGRRLPSASESREARSRSRRSVAGISRPMRPAALGHGLARFAHRGRIGRAVRHPGEDARARRRCPRRRRSSARPSSARSVRARSYRGPAPGPVPIEAQKQTPPGSVQFTATMNRCLAAALDEPSGVAPPPSTRPRVCDGGQVTAAHPDERVPRYFVDVRSSGSRPLGRTTAAAGPGAGTASRTAARRSGRTSPVVTAAQPVVPRAGIHAPSPPAARPPSSARPARSRCPGRSGRSPGNPAPRGQRSGRPGRPRRGPARRAPV